MARSVRIKRIVAIVACLFVLVAALSLWSASRHPITPFGKVGIAICWDAFHEDVIQALVGLGADILVQPSANPGAWNEEQQKDWLRGAWTVLQKQSRFRFALNPMMTGNLFDVVFEGQSTVVKHAAKAPGGPSFPSAPVEGGFVAMAKDADGEEVLVTPMD